jgi:hypothetical protein
MLFLNASSHYKRFLLVHNEKSLKNKLLQQLVYCLLDANLHSYHAYVARKAVAERKNATYISDV